MQERGTYFRIDFLQLIGCRKQICLLLMACAVFVFTAPAAQARHGASIPKKTAYKKSGLTAAATKIKKTSAGKIKKTNKVFSKAAEPLTRTGSSVPLLSADQRQIRSELEKYIGSRYKPGGTGSGGFDCSGFARSMYQKLFGVDLPHNAQSQFHLPGLSKLSHSSLKTGDLVFFAATAKKKRINHVGIYLDDGRFIHAQSRRGVVISSMEDDHWRDRLVSTKRLETSGLQIDQAYANLQDEDALDEFEEIEQEEPAGFQVAYRAKRRETTGHAQDGFSGRTGRATAGRQQFAELKYVRPIFGKYCNFQVGALQHSFDLYEGSAGLFDTEQDLSNQYSVFSYSQALRIASDIRPFGWMSISPSCMFYRHGRELEYEQMPERSLGLDMNLGSLDASWSLSTALSYSRLGSSAFRSARTGDPGLLDISLTYSRRLTDGMQLSLMGQRLRSPVSDRLDEIGGDFSTDQRFFFMLNYSY